MERFFPGMAEGFIRLLGSLEGRKVAVIGHARPDGDCIGAQVALARILQAGGREAICVNSDPVPRRLRFVAGEMTFVRTDDIVADGGDPLAIFVDCADHGRAGVRIQARFPNPAGNIDHHLSNVGFAAVNLVDSTAAASCEVLAGLFLDHHLPIDRVTAMALYTGILTDTGQFRFNSTSRRCFSLAGELVARGAEPATAGFELYERESAGKLRLLERFLSTLTLECGGRVCLGSLSSAVFAETGTTAEDTEGLVDYPRSIDGVEVGGLIEDRPDGGVKVSLRCKDPIYRVDLIAGQFGGGGHACAAGLNLPKRPANFRSVLIEALARRLAEVDAEKQHTIGLNGA